MADAAQVESTRDDRKAAEDDHGDRKAQGGDSVVTVLIALAANVVIAIAKTIAAVITGSASMVAESAHSWADSGNEVFLFIANKRAQAAPTPRHPLGFGRDSYVWSLFAAIGLFTVGAVVSVQHGIAELGERGPAEDPVINYVVLAIAFVLEGTSFLRGLSQVRSGASEAESELLAFTLNNSDPTVRAVVFEDGGALIGVLLAVAGVGLHQLTGSAVYDAAGSIGIGLVLGVLAIVLIQQNRKFLIGEAVDARIRGAALRELLAQDLIESVSYLHIEFVGPGSVFLVAAVDLAGDAPEHTVAARLGTLSDELQSRPHIRRAVLTLSVPGAAPVEP